MFESIIEYWESLKQKSMDSSLFTCFQANNFGINLQSVLQFLKKKQRPLRSSLLVLFSLFFFQDYHWKKSTFWYMEPLARKSCLLGMEHKIFCKTTYNEIRSFKINQARYSETFILNTFLNLSQIFKLIENFEDRKAAGYSPSWPLIPRKNIHALSITWDTTFNSAFDWKANI